MMCIFIKNWDCNFAGQEITLEICKTCIDAKRLYNETKHDRALQNRMEKMEEQPKEEPKPERPYKKKKEKPPKRQKESIVETPAIETKTPVESALGEGRIPPKDSDESILDFLEDEIYKDESKDERERLEPVSVEETRNFDGELKDIQNDPTNPSDTWMKGKGEEGVVVVGFPNPPEKLVSGENLQEFLIRVRRTDNTSSAFPEVNLKICEEGDVVAETGRQEVKDIHGEVISLEWNAGVLLDMYGSDIEMIIECFSSESDGEKNYVEIGGVEWRATLVETEEDVSDEEDTFEERLASSLNKESEESIDAITSDLNP